jgi:cobalt-zinc-cadmium efflux system protein
MQVARLETDLRSTRHLSVRNLNEAMKLRFMVFSDSFCIAKPSRSARMHNGPTMNEHSHHDHAHSAGHSHAPADFGKAFVVGITLNVGFVVVEVVYGLLSNSVALIADAGHNLGDVLGLAMAWVATVLARRAPSQTHTYGLRRGTILAALANAMLLLVAVGAIAVEAVRRLADPQPVASLTVMAVALVGILVNGVTAWLFAAGRQGDINLRAAFLHMAYDAVVSLGVVLAAGLIWLTGWTRVDALVSLGVAAVILVGTWGLLKESVGMSLDAVPAGLKPTAVADFIRKWPGVTTIHDLHIWPMSTTETALTCHCVMPGGHPGDEALMRLAHELHEHFNIGHVTVQIEVDPDARCALEPDHVV